MTKAIKLTKDYMTHIFNGELNKGRKIHGKYHFFSMELPACIAGGEGYKKSDVANDPTNVPIYNQDKSSPNFGDIIRHEGSNATPATSDIEFFGCTCDEIMSVATAKANEFLTFRFKTDQKSSKIYNVFKEVI